MSAELPHFKYRFVAKPHKRVLCIEDGGEVIHEVGDVMGFYKVFGYRPESTHANVLPDEFIWTEYIHNSAADFSSCIQMHIIEYLKAHSERFNEKYGAIYHELVARHEEEKANKGASCFACKALGVSHG